MKKLATAIAAIALIGTPAFAADIAVKAPPSPPPAPVYNWTGWYVGGNVGASFGTDKTDFNAAGSATEIVSFFPVGTVVDLATAVAGSGFDEVYPGGFIGGGQIGFNWQLSPLWVVGAEADFQGADEKEHSTLSFGVSGPLSSFGNPTGTTATGTAAFDYTAKIEWFGTARVRAGYLFGDGAVLTYVTGGLAYGKVDVEGTSALSSPLQEIFPLTSVPSVAQTFGHSNVNTGWVVGTGTEGKLVNFPGWSFRIEGLYMDLGHLDTTGPGASFTSIPGFTLIAGPVHTNTHFTDTILRAGLNYQFH
jgi:outer membrane immunogenic protein